MADKPELISNKAAQAPKGWRRVPAWLARLGLDSFLLALLAMIGLAYLWPELGQENGRLPLDKIGTYGVSVIFFFYGLRLSPEKLWTGLSNWRLHLVVQLTTFLLFPVLILLLMWLVSADAKNSIWLGVFYLAALPSTVSSSVVMVSIAGGNMPSAIFNASISSLLGVFITPLWMGLMLQHNTGAFDLGSVLIKLILQVVVPVVLGIMLHKRGGSLAERYRSQIRYFDQAIILLIVFTAFCDSFAGNQFQNFSLLNIILLSSGMAGLFFLVYGLVYAASNWFNFNPPNRITALFCGSKKSMVHGTVMSKVIFSGNPHTGLILLPLMLYHALQLIFASIIARTIARRTQKSGEEKSY